MRQGSLNLIQVANIKVRSNCYPWSEVEKDMANFRLFNEDQRDIIWFMKIFTAFGRQF